MGFAKDIGMTVWRVLGGFLIAAVLALPLGVAMGAYKPIEAFFEPFVSFARYLPASAFIPLLILWAGIGEAQKLAVIFIGSFFQLVLMIAVTVGNTRRDLVEAAYTLGSSDASLIRRVLIPGAAPEIAETLRMVLGWAWTYVIVAELIGASSGIGHMITDSQALLATDQIIFGIIVIGLIGLVSDFAFKWANRRAVPVGATGPLRTRMSNHPHACAASSAAVDTDTLALQATDLDVAENDFITILGPSGCGKSTLLRIVAGLDRQTAGEVLLDGQRITGPGADRGMVFQSYTLFPWLTVRDNVCFGLRERGLPRASSSRSAHAFLAKVGLRGFENHYPEAAVGRHAAAHGDRPRAGQRPAHAADGRALRRARPPDPRADAGAAARHLGGRAQDGAVRHPRHRRGGVHGQPRRRDERAPGAHQARPRGADLPHPRHYSVKTTPAFTELKAELTEQVRVEVRAAQAAAALIT